MSVGSWMRIRSRQASDGFWGASDNTKEEGIWEMMVQLQSMMIIRREEGMDGRVQSPED